MKSLGTRRLQFPERLISAAEVAYDDRQFGVAKRLLMIAENDLRKEPMAMTRKREKVYEEIAAMHAKLWEALQFDRSQSA